MKTSPGDKAPIVMADYPNEQVAQATTCGVCGCAVPAGAWVVRLDIGVLVCSSSCMAQCDSPSVDVVIVDLEQQAKDLEQEADELRGEADQLEWKASDIREQVKKIQEARRAVPLLEVA